VAAHAAIVWWWLHPLIRHLSSALPGTGAGDNLTFLWNLWWMRYVLHHPGLSFFSTAFLFYPVGTDLTLHTHTALPAFAAAVAGPSSLVASQNLLIVAHLFLNLVCSYALAYRLTRDAGAAFVASIVFGASPFIGAHLPGHFNLIAAWTLPLVALLWHEASNGASMVRSAICGLALAGTAYMDYYLFVYAVLLVAVLTIGSRVEWTAAPAARSISRRVVVVLTALLAIDALIIAAILLLETDRFVLGSFRVSLRSIKNPVTAAWILVLIATVAACSRRARLKSRPSAASLSSVILPAALVSCVTLLPLIARAVKLWSKGDYVSQPYLWRSAPAGVDVATLIFGNPFNAFWGAPIRTLYGVLHIDLVEAGGWLPVGALVLTAIAVRLRRNDPVLRAWMFAAIVFVVWALGPWLMVLGRQSPLVLPGLLVRYVPIVANARMPGRAMLVVYLAVALLAAFGVTSLKATGNRGRMTAWALALLVFVDCAPAPPPIFFPRVPLQYRALGGAAGAVCELPLGLRDGFGETGAFDSAILLHQTVHQRPVLGGFVARLPRSVVREYNALPVVSSLLHLSSGGRLTDESRGDARTNTMQLAALGVSYVVVDTRVASPDLRQYVEIALALRALGEEDGRAFYEVPR